MVKGLFDSYKDFVEHARSIRGYGSWHFNCLKAFNDFNEWLSVDGEGPVTKFEMSFLESMYLQYMKDDIEFMEEYKSWRSNDEE